MIGFRGSVENGTQLHPDNQHLIFSMGCQLVVRNVLERSMDFLRGHDNVINSIAISPTGTLVGSGQTTHMGFPADVIIWDFASRQEKYRLTLHKVCVQCINFSPTEQYVVTLGGQDDNSIVVWNLDNGQPICGCPAFSETANFVQFFRGDDFQLISGGAEHLRVWKLDVENRKLRPSEIKVGTKRRVWTKCAIDSFDSVAHVGTTTGDVFVVDLVSHMMVGTVKAKRFEKGVTAISMLENGEIIIGGGVGEVIRCTSVRNADNVVETTCVKKCQVLGGVTSIAPTCEGSNMFIATTKNNLYWADSANLTAQLRNTCHDTKISAIAFPHEHSSCFATAAGCDIRVWNSGTRQELLRVEVTNQECIALAFSRDGKSIISGWQDGKIRAFFPQSGRIMFTIHDAHKNGVSALVGTSDSGKIVSGGIEGEVRIWDIRSDCQVMTQSMKEHRGRVFQLRLKQDDSQAVSASADGSVIIWDLSTGHRVSCLFDSTQFKSLIYHPDESQLVTTGSDRKITYWDVFDGSAIRVIEGSVDSDITGLSVTKSGSHFVSVGGDRLVKLWDYDRGINTHVGHAHSGDITAVHIAPDQKSIISVGADMAIAFWEMPADVIEAACDTSGLDNCNAVTQEIGA